MPAVEEGWTDWQIVLKPGAEPGDLLQACVQANLALRDFEAHSATLHDVFLHLAGSPPEAAR
jgi:ABC-2 type transport system ATP-binding protein